MGRPAAPSRGSRAPAVEIPRVADRRELALSVADPCLRTRVAGLFLFVPLLARLGFDELVGDAGYPGSRMVPADAALLSLLALKLLDKDADFRSRPTCLFHTQSSSVGRAFSPCVDGF